MPATPASDDLLALDRQVCFALAVASRNVIGLYRPLLEPMGLTHPQYLVMLALWEESPLTVAELGRRTRAKAERIPPAIVARLGMSLRELEELRDGLTRVIDASRDERVSSEPGG